VKKTYPSRRLLLLLVTSGALSFLPLFWSGGLAACALANFIVLALAGADFALSRPVDPESVEIEAPEEMGVGRSALFRLRWSPPGSGRTRTQIEMAFPPALEPKRTFWDRTPEVEEEAVVETAFRAAYRGTARIGPGRLRHRSRWGLWVLESALEARTKIDVLPDLENLKKEDLKFAAKYSFTPGVKALLRPDREGEFDSLTKYIPGMDLRKIDWKASAKHRSLLSRKFIIERNHHVYLAMDTGRLMGTRTGSLAKLDWAMTSALRLAFLALKTGDNVGLMGFGDDMGEFLRSAKGMAHFRRIIDASDRLTPTPEETNYNRAFHLFSRYQRRRSLLVVFTDFVDRVSATLLLEALSYVSRRHLVLFVACRDQELFERTLVPPASLADMHEHNEIFRLLGEREQVLLEMQRMNIHTLDLDASRVTVPLLNAYFRLKSEQRI